jgi:hypothetical protein
LAVDVDISRWSLDDGIDFKFPEGTVIPAGKYLLIAASPPALMAATGQGNVLGPFTSRLSNAGERLRLRNQDGRIMDQVTYGAEGDWPVAPDGSGPSLARRRADILGAHPENWLASAQVGGTPGAENFPIHPPTIVSNTVVTVANAWKFNDTGTDLGAGWRSPSYDDAGWPNGSALFFHGPAPLAATGNTSLTPGRITYYFRARFDHAGGDLSRVQLQLRPIVDDGAIGYLNGVEIFRLNMPGSAVSYSTLANGQVGDAAFGEPILIPSEQLRAGPNVLAVEVHQGPSFTAYSQAIIGSGPIGYWRLGETSGAALDSASTAGAQNGTYAGFLASNLGQGGPRPTDLIVAQPLVGFEADNHAPRFAGNADGGNDVVTIPDPGVFNFAATRIFTLEAWVNGPAAQEGGGPIVAKGTGGGGEQFAVDVVNGNYRFYGWDGGTPNNAVVANASVGPDNTWQHVVAVLDQPAGRMKIYVNGIERGTQTPRPTLVNTSHEVSIGARKGSGGPSYDLNFDGRIDEVAIYNRALSPAEILAHFNSAFTNNAASGPDTNDLVFGLEAISAETLPEPETPRLAFNELASSTNAAFWLELINHGRVEANLGGWTIARFGGMTNREYTLPPTVLAPGQLLGLTKAELGFGVDSGDRLVLYGPGRTNVSDSVVAKKDPRGRWPDGTGAWWFPLSPTLGASNHFQFRDELVINEIMYHARELPAVPATSSPTNLFVTISNLWRYHAQGVDLGTAWRLPAYDDSAWMASNAVFYAPTNPFALPAPKNTFLPLTNSSGARLITAYFRTQFQFDGDTNGVRLGLRSIIDDGAVFYLNGVEVHRLNMPPGEATYNTLATANVGIPGFTGPVVIPATALVSGLNTLAVEFHNVAAQNSDIDFGTELLVWRELTPALPFRDSPGSWVEIFNRSSHPVDLTGWRLDEGIDFRFPAGKILAPGGYLVVAKDVDYLQALHPGLDVVGPFTNKLSHSSDYIALKDPANNLADEVRYFDDGREGGDADGGGSSLELRDPRADNSRAESWAPSDESGKSGWQTYTWRRVAAPGQTGEPTLWHELALCLLDGPGEVLLDDISVIETPLTTPKQLIVNGAFDGGSAAHWRFLGNHRHSRVELEPGDPGNFVLRLVARGAGEYQGNQIETTLTNNVDIVNGREYEISYRARWLAGKSKVNARVYFNRLARTFDLATPARGGTPGAVNSRYAPNIGPTFAGLAHTPPVPSVNQPVTITVVASDPDGLGSLTLYYSVAGGPWQSRLMSLQAPSPSSSLPQFTATIPGQAAGAIVQFYVEGMDTLGAISVYPGGGTNSRALFVVQDNQAAPPPLHNFRIVMTADDATFMHTGTNTLSNELLGATVISDERDVYYDVGVRLKGSFVGRNVARVGFHVAFNPWQLFRGVHGVVSVDRSQHTAIGSVGEIVTKHIANHAGGIPNMQDDLARCIAPLSSYTSLSQLRFSGFDSDYLDAQFKDGSDGPQFEVEVIRWNVATVGGNPENPKQVGNEAGGTGYANLEMQNYGDDRESYRWFLLQVNRRTADDYARAMTAAQTFSLPSPAFEVQARQALDVDEWLRVMAYQQLVGTADAYFTGANIHNFRLYIRPEDQKALYMPWDWDSSFLAAPTASLFGSGNIAKLVTDQNQRRVYLNHLYDILTTTFNATYMTPWISHYGSVSGQNMSSILNYITARASYALGQLPTATAFAITSNSGSDFATSNATVTLTGTAPIQVKAIEVNGILYPVTWTSATAWTISLPLFGGLNSLAVQGVDNYGNRPVNATDTISVTNTGPSALRPVVINEWMADNAGPMGLADPADGLFQDWFELFNPNASAVNLTGFYLTDNLSQPTKWRIPSTTIIGGGGFLLVWADNQPGQNSGIPNSDLHAPFALNNEGEALGLFNPDGVTPQSTVVFALQMENVSQGYHPDGDTNVVFSMANFSPREPNNLAGPLQITTISLSGGIVTLTWDTIPGRRYRVEFKQDLSAPVWNVLGEDIAAGGNSATMNNPIGSGGRGFYRVVRAW